MSVSQALATGLARLLRRFQLINPEITAGHRGMQALVAPGVAAFLVLTPRDADQAAVIAEVMEQGASDAAAQIAGGRGWIGDLPAGEPELHLGHLPGIFQLEDAAAGGHADRDGISEGQELLKEGIGLELGVGHGLIAKDARPKASTEEKAKLSKDKQKDSPPQNRRPLQPIE